MFRDIAIAHELRNERLDHDMRLAWHIAALTRGTKGLPKLERLLISGRTTRQQSPREQVAMWQTIAARFGGTFKPVTH